MPIKALVARLPPRPPSARKWWDLWKLPGVFHFSASMDTVPSAEELAKEGAAAVEATPGAGMLVAYKLVLCEQIHLTHPTHHHIHHQADRAFSVSARHGRKCNAGERMTATKCTTRPRYVCVSLRFDVLYNVALCSFSICSSLPRLIFDPPNNQNRAILPYARSFASSSAATCCLQSTASEAGLFTEGFRPWGMQVRVAGQCSMGACSKGKWAGGSVRSACVRGDWLVGGWAGG